jgi:hypothetical protein
MAIEPRGVDAGPVDESGAQAVATTNAAVESNARSGEWRRMDA